MTQRIFIAAFCALLLTPCTARAAIVAVEGDTLHVAGTDGSERILLEQDGGGTIEVWNLGADDELDAGTGCTSASGSYALCARAGVTKALIELGGGDDQYVYGRFSLPTTVYGGPGDDELDDTPGVDVLDGGPGDDVLWMDNGPDADPDVLIGGDGFDIASYGQWRGEGQGLRLSIDGVANDGVAGEDDDIHTDIEGLRGGYADDVLVGSPGDDYLSGGDGDDVLEGGDGDDDLEGVSGTDELHGDGGFDVADYSRSEVPVHVTLDGKANDGPDGENDLVGADVEGALGGYAGDVLVGNGGDNLLEGFEGDDEISDPGGEDDILGDEGDDDIEAADGARDHVECGDGSDQVWRDADDDVDGDCELSTIGPRSADPEPTPTPTPTATPTPGPTPVIHIPITRATRPVATRPADTTAPDASVSVAAKPRATTLRRRGLTLTVRCNELCTAEATLKGRHGTVATGSLKGSSTSRRTLRLRLTAAGRHALSRGRYTLTVTVTDGAGNTDSVVRTLQVR
jgi:Ca2+-binding RTX toxin-like protein